jgi:hypothetical protein
MGVHRQPILEKDGTLWWGIAAGLLFTAEFIFVYWGLEFTNASRHIIFCLFYHSTIYRLEAAGI